jgi:hypothetical protein
VVCTASDACHVAGVCNTGTGICSNPNAANGTTCNDGNGCTQTDTCQSGTCSGANPVTCTALDQCHVAGVCSAATGTCSNPNKANGTACNDGNACTSGSCGGTPITAPAEVQNLTAASNKRTYNWSSAASATQYDVVRGGVNGLPVGPGGGDEACFGGLSGPTVTDNTNPAVNSAFWYLARGGNVCGNGTYGNQGSHGAPGAPRVTTTCP